MDTNKIEKGIELVLSGLVGNDWRADENFSETPARVAKAYKEMLYGHDLRRTDMAKFFEKKFPAAGYSQMIFCTGIKVYSMCPHHLLPVTYNVSVGYIPNEKEGYVIGASKLPRLVEALAAQAIIQEELTSEIAKEIQFHLNPTGIALVVSGQHLCYDDQTDILTDNGWKKFSELGRWDKVAQYNQELESITFVYPTEYISYPYQGDMISMKSKNYDLLVTPDHRVLCSSEWKYKNSNGKFVDIVTAEQLLDQRKTYLPKTAKNGKTDGVRINSIYGVNGDDFCEFMGWYLADGCCSYRNNRKTVCITKSRTKNNGQDRKDLLSLLDKLGCDYRESEADNNITITGEFLQCVFPLLFECGKSRDKFVPRVIKSSTQEQINLFLDAYIRCDGHIYENGKVHFCTISKQLLSDLQEMLLYVGKSGSIQSNNMRMETNKGYACLDSQHITKTYYDGYVYCVSVPDSLLVVRRNGKVSISGNCMQARGIKQRGSSFETSEMRGAFRENESTRNEFFELLKNSQR